MKTLNLIGLLVSSLLMAIVAVSAWPFISFAAQLSLAAIITINFILFKRADVLGGKEFTNIAMMLSSALIAFPTSWICGLEMPIVVEIGSDLTMMLSLVILLEKGGCRVAAKRFFNL